MAKAWAGVLDWSVSLDAPQLLALASQAVDGEVTLDAELRAALDALTKALRQEARLSAEGLARTQARLVDELVQRARLATFEREHPQLAELPVERPIIITGFPRTGTTLLHNLLARVEGLWAPSLWQLHSPLAGGDDGASRAKTEALLAELYGAAPAFRGIHPMHPDWPDQCNCLLRKSFSTMANAFAWYVPGYVQFLTTCDMRPAYADHRRWLKALLVQREAQAGARPRLALRDPFHMWHTQALLEVYPDATIIHLHRDPAEVVPSFASLCATLQSVDADAARRPAEIGRFCLFILSHGLSALEKARQQAGDRYIDLSYRELVASPGAVLRELGNRLGFDGSGDAVEQAGEWLGENRQYKAGRHNYSLDDFGIAPEIIDEYFASYRARFADRF